MRGPGSRVAGPRSEMATVEAEVRSGGGLIPEPGILAAKPRSGSPSLHMSAPGSSSRKGQRYLDPLTIYLEEERGALSPVPMGTGSGP